MTNPALRFVPPKSWETIEPLTVQANGYTVTIAENFHSDLASVPAFIRGIPGFAAYELGGPVPPIVHDWLYQSKGHGGVFSRMDADRIFHHLMRDNGVGRVRAWVAWVAVRLGGGLIWRPDPNGWKDIVWRAAHTAWQTGIALMLFDNFYAVVAAAVGLSGLKSVLRFGAMRGY